MDKKLLIVAAGIFLLAAGCGKPQPQPVNEHVGQSARRLPTVQLTPTTTTSANLPPAQSTTAHAPAATSTTQAPPPDQTQTRANPGKPDYRPGYIIVSQAVEGSKLDEPYVQVPDGASAYDLLITVHKVSSTNYGSGMGEMVNSIDGVAPDSNHFWEFLVNGQFSNVGASTYKLHDGDTLDWKLESINNSKE